MSNKVLLSLWQSKLFSDATIKAFGQEYRIHKAILSIQSDYFKSIFEDVHQEKETILEMNDEDEIVSSSSFAQFIQYFYTGTLDKEVDFAPLLLLADKYSVLSLLEYLVASVSIEDTPPARWITILTLYRLRENLKINFDIFFEAVARNFCSLCHYAAFLKLPSSIISIILDHPALVISSEGMITKFILKYQPLAQENPDFIYQYLSSSRWRNVKRLELCSAVVCFYIDTHSDRAQQYKKMTIYAVNSFLSNTPMIPVGILCPLPKENQCLIRLISNITTE